VPRVPTHLPSLHSLGSRAPTQHQAGLVLLAACSLDCGAHERPQHRSHSPDQSQKMRWQKLIWCALVLDCWADRGGANQLPIANQASHTELNMGLCILSHRASMCSVCQPGHLVPQPQGLRCKAACTGPSSTHTPASRAVAMRPIQHDLLSIMCMLHPQDC